MHIFETMREVLVFIQQHSLEWHVLLICGRVCYGIALSQLIGDLIKVGTSSFHLRLTIWFLTFFSTWLDLFLLSSHWIPNSHPNRKQIHMQNPPKSQPRLGIISCCFSQSDTNFMRIASANMYINLTLRVWCRALQGLTNQTETEGRNSCGEGFYCITLYHAKKNVMMSYISKFCNRWIIARCCLTWCYRPIAAVLMLIQG